MSAWWLPIDPTSTGAAVHCDSAFATLMKALERLPCCSNWLTPGNEVTPAMLILLASGAQGMGRASGAAMPPAILLVATTVTPLA